MISIEFLRGRVDGLEFMDFQNNVFYTKLSECLEEYIDADGKLNDGFIDKIKPIIKEFTGFSNIDMGLIDYPNIAVDVGYFSPNHVLNNQMADKLSSHTNTTLYDWFTKNQKIFKGGINYKTGKVYGDFETIPVWFVISDDLNTLFPKARVGKYKVPYSGLLAGSICHELGHVFGACMMLLTTCTDNLLAKAGLSYFQEAETKDDRVTVLRDIGSILDVDSISEKEMEDISQNKDAEHFMLFYNKLLDQRNKQRSLSVGVEVMSSEVIADMYAVRMGCEKGVMAAIGILGDSGALIHKMEAVKAALISSVFGVFSLIPVVPIFAIPLTAPTLIGASALIGSLSILNGLIAYFRKGYSGDYNVGHRRFDDMLRQMIAKVRETKDMPLDEQQASIKNIQELLAVNEKMKPWYDNTTLYRVMGRIFAGKDFRLSEVEHYTNVLANHEINLLANQFKILK